jgi:hypothetical protein
MIGLFLLSTKQSFADVQLSKDILGLTLSISNTISKNDADYVIQHEADFKKIKMLTVQLDSQGGDVDAALKIGRIIRDNEAHVWVSTEAKCFSSCTLIYIAGVTRNNFGLIGLHRPYFASTPLSRREIERQAPLMLQMIKDYVQSMGVTDLFYQEMVNTEPSNIRLYPNEGIKKLVPENDPTYEEIQISYDARYYGINTAEMRQRRTDAEKCSRLLPDDSERWRRCSEAILWRLSERVYEERETKMTQLCKLSDEDAKKLREAGKDFRDLPAGIKREACVRNIMLGR